MSKLHRVFDGEFGSVSVLEVTGELVTHVHSTVNISFWLSGAPAFLTLNGRQVGHDAWAACVINAMVPHGLKLDDHASARTLSFYLDPHWLARNLPSGCPTSFVDLELRTTPPLREQLWALADLLLDDEADGYELDCAVLHFLRKALSCARPREADADAKDRRPRDFRLRKAVALMRENMSRGVDMEAVARAAGLSRPHLFTLFRDQLDLTPSVFWNSLRVEEAMHQMRVSEENLTALAASLGFTAQGNFTRFFRQHTGVAPSAYRGALTGSAGRRASASRQLCGPARGAPQALRR